jgi:hypothetical protein
MYILPKSILLNKMLWSIVFNRAVFCLVTEIELCNGVTATEEMKMNSILLHMLATKSCRDVPISFAMPVCQSACNTEK